MTTGLLRDWAKGDKAAVDRPTLRVYRELRRIVGHLMQNEREGRALQATALAREAYLKLIDVDNVDWRHRAHFFAISAQVMRHTLLDAARKHGTAKHPTRPHGQAKAPQHAQSDFRPTSK